MKVMLVLLIVVIAVIFVILFGPRERVYLDQPFDQARLDQGVESYLATSEAQYDDIRPGLQKQVIWAGDINRKTDIVLVYFHGFSSSKEDIRPVPDLLAQALGANIYYARLPGHGRPGAAMGDIEAIQWLAAYDEAMAIAAKLGDRAIIMGTSTGASLAAVGVAMLPARLEIAGLAFISPNFGIQNRAAILGNLFGFRLWGPWIGGRDRIYEPRNDQEALYWTLRYPLQSIVPMMRLLSQIDRSDYSKQNQPLMIVYSKDDQIVRPDKIETFAKGWGGPVRLDAITLGPSDDQYAHVIAGRVLSPNQNQPISAALIDWAKGL